MSYKANVYMWFSSCNDQEIQLKWSYTDCSKETEKQISYINAGKWHLERWYWWADNGDTGLPGAYSIYQQRNMFHIFN